MRRQINTGHNGDETRGRRVDAAAGARELLYAPTMETSRYLAAQPLPERPFLPGTGMPRPTGESLLADDAGAELPNDWPTSPAFLFGVDLLNAGYYWEAHEQWEGLWKTAAQQSAERAVLQGLIQAAASMLKAKLEQRGGAISLAMSANEHLLAGNDGVDHHALGFSPAAFAASVIEWAHVLAEGRTEQPPALRLTNRSAG